LRAASDAGSPSSPVAKNGLEPHDGGDTAPKATEGQGGDAAHDVIEDHADAAIDGQSHKV
jgi:hypothetical protein